MPLVVISIPKEFPCLNQLGGSAPKYTGQGKINPLAAIAAGQMMLAELGEAQAAEAVETAIKKAVKNDLASLSAGKMGYTTAEVGDLVRDYV